MTYPLISVIIPVYNAEKYLEKCVRSITNQTYENLEIILVDDGSTDNCPSICDALSKEDKRIKVIHKTNGGAGSARRAGISCATGEYIGFVDSDDFIKEDMYEVLYTLLVNNDSQIAKIGHIELQFGEQVPLTDHDEPSLIVSDQEEMILRYMHEGNWDKLYKRDLFNGLPDLPDLRYREDNLLNFFLFKNAKKMVESSQKEYFFVRHSDSITSGCINYSMIDDSLKYYDYIENFIDKDSQIFKKYIYNRVLGDLFCLNSIIRNNKCRDRYKLLRTDILKYRNLIFKQDLHFEMKHKAGILLLIICPKIYDLSVLIIKKIRGY